MPSSFCIMNISDWACTLVSNHCTRGVYLCVCSPCLNRTLTVNVLMWPVTIHLDPLKMVLPGPNILELIFQKYTKMYEPPLKLLVSPTFIFVLK